MRFCAVFFAVFAAACAEGAEPSPFDLGGSGGTSNAGAGGAAGGVSVLVGGGGTNANAVPCTVDAMCDDMIDCTRDRCDQTVGECAHTTDDAMCDDGLTCDGEETCDDKLGCRAGDPPTCTDNDACTIDACDEDTKACTHTPRDADADGDVDAHCGGGDCDDTNPFVSSKSPEICANKIDDNCDGQVDEMPCVSPPSDTCVTALVLAGPGAYAMPTTGGHLDYGSTCTVANATTARDVVAAITVPAGPDVSLDVSVRVPYGTVAVALQGQCGDASTQITCGMGAQAMGGGQVVRVRAFDLAPGTYPIIIYTDQDTTATLEVDFGAVGTPPTNETCGTATPLTVGVTTTVPLFAAKVDLPLTCVSAAPDLVYAIDVPTKSDVRVLASPADPTVQLTTAIFSDPCNAMGAQQACRFGSPIEAFARGLGPGTVYIDLGSNIGTDVSLLATLEPPTVAPADETCVGSPPMPLNTQTIVDLTDHEDDVMGCGPGFVDAAFAVTAPNVSDALMLLRVSQGDSGTISLWDPPCAASMTQMLACSGNGNPPYRAIAHGLAPGSYRAVVELQYGPSATMLGLVRDALPSTFVSFADDCDTAFPIGETGAILQGNTQNASANYSAGCDYGGTGPYGAPEQMLTFTLTQKRRVLIDSAGSTYNVLLDVRKADGCPGDEIDEGCSISYDGRAFLDLTLDVGTYYIQVDGTNLASGSWVLDVWTTDPELGGDDSSATP